MSAQEIVDIAKSANAITLGTPDAGAQFREEYTKSIRCSIQLSPSQKEVVKNNLTFNVAFTSSSPNTSDHPVIAALRDITRNAYYNVFDPLKTDLRVLAVGSSFREFKLYNSRANVHYFFHNSEPKDITRSVVPIINTILRNLKRKVKKKDSRVFSSSADTEVRPQLKRYKELSEVLNDLKKTQDMPKVFHTDYDKLPEASVLLFEDSFYNFDEAAFIKIFEKTNALAAYGYGLLPWEMIYPDMPKNELYKYAERGGHSYFSYKYGYSTGYVHKTRAWRTLLHKMILKGNSFNVVAEIVVRVGPMVVFRMDRVPLTDIHLYRELSLPENLRYVRLLDFYSTIDNTTGFLKRPFKYISVVEAEYFEMINYNLSLDEKSMSLDNAVTFVRRRRQGISLVAKTVVKGWQLPANEVYKFALTTYFQAKLLRSKTKLLETKHAIGDFGAKLRRFVEKFGRFLFLEMIPFADDLFDYVMSEHLVGELVLYDCGEIEQEEYTKKFPVAVEAEDMDLPLLADLDPPGDMDDCPICFKYDKKKGPQIVKCDYKKESEHTFVMTEDDLARVRMNLIDDDKDPPGIREVKARALKNLPTSPFSYTTRVEHVRGPPGTGKSYLVRALAGEKDFVAAPFTKLKADYENLKRENEDGHVETYDILFKTTHRAMEISGKELVFNDEFTAFDYDILACIAFNNAAEIVYLVGDTKQTKIQSAEGVYIGNKIDLEKLSTHTLIRNFRNPRDAVAVHNMRLGYECEAMSEVEKSFEIINAANIHDEEYVGIPIMHFSEIAAKTYTVESNTVRSNQGWKYDEVILLAVEADGPLLSCQELLAVALSRHVNKCYLAVDDSTHSKNFIDWLNLDDIWANIDKYSNKAPKMSKEKKTDRVALMIETNTVPRKALKKDSETELKEGVVDCCKNFCASVFKKEEESEVPPVVVENPTPAETENTEDDEEVSDTSSLNTLETVNFSFDQYSESSSDEAASEVDEQEEMQEIRTESLPLRYSIEETTPRYEQVHEMPDVAVKYRRPKVVRQVPLVSYAFSTPVTVHRHSRKVKKLIDTTHGDDEVFEYSVKMEQFVRDLKQFAKDDMDEFVGYYSMGRVVKFNYIDREYKESSTHPSSDAYIYGDLDNPTVTMSYFTPTTNDQFSSVVLPDFRSGMMSIDSIFPFNSRGHPKSLEIKYHAYSAGYGLKYTNKNPWQRLQAMQTRYLCKRKSLMLTPEASEHARKAVDLFIFECMNIDAERIKITETAIAEITQDFIKAAISRNYDLKVDGIDYTAGREVRFHLKDIFKPMKNEKFNITKVGQGISALSAEVNLYFGKCVRIINELFINSLKDNVIYNNKLTDRQFIEKVRRALEFVPPVAVPGTADAEQYDSGQNEYTQEVEKELFKRGLKIDPDFIEFLYSVRSKLIMVSDDVKAKTDYENYSGHPGTLLCNSALMMVEGNSILRGKGDFVAIGQGDDFAKIQADLHMDMTFQNEMQKYTPMKLSLSENDAIEFCGYTLVKNNLYPSITRKLKKIEGHSFRDYMHFCEYRKSLLDWLDLVNDIGAEDAVGMTAAQGNVPYDIVNFQLDRLKSFAHLNEEQFYRMFPEVTQVVEVPITHIGPEEFK